MNPFGVVYGKNEPSVLSYILSVSKVHEVENNLTLHAAIICTLKENLVLA
jgi:hypothetical protein